MIRISFRKQERPKGFSFVFCSHMCPTGTVCQGTRCIYPKPPIIGELSLSGDEKDLDPYSIDSKTKKSKLKKILTSKLVQALTNDILRKKVGRRGKNRTRKRNRGSKQGVNKKDLKTKNG
uniref:Uncharacterized protein n=1 Tax=Romanomermis culicivorax TaxID=13658 RepID=A0A915IKW6_ROMCU